MLPSGFFLGLILVGGAAVVVGFTFYSRAKSAEDRAAQGRAADAILKPEILANIDFARGLKAALMQDKTPVNNFETASWETAARGGLLSGYAPERSSKIIGFYNNIYRARANLSDLQNYTFGEGATRSNRQEMMTAYRGVLGLATDEILKAAQQPVATERAAMPVPPASSGAPAAAGPLAPVKPSAP